MNNNSSYVVLHKGASVLETSHISYRREKEEIRCSSFSGLGGSIFTIWHKFNYDSATKSKQNVLEQCHGVSDVFSHLCGLHMKEELGFT